MRTGTSGFACVTPSTSTVRGEPVRLSHIRSREVTCWFSSSISSRQYGCNAPAYENPPKRTQVPLVLRKMWKSKRLSKVIKSTRIKMVRP